MYSNQLGSGSGTGNAGKIIIRMIQGCMPVFQYLHMDTIGHPAKGRCVGDSEPNCRVLCGVQRPSFACSKSIPRSTAQVVLSAHLLVTGAYVL
jgi:hypothetical protein